MIGSHRYIYLIGGGGKTTLMFRLARWLEERGERVLTSTSTRIWPPSPEQVGRVFIERSIRELLGELRENPPRHATVAKGCLGGKLIGFSPAELDELWEAKVCDALIVEADGSAGRPLKAHLNHEPVVSQNAELVVAVVGADCVGRPLDEETVHRPERFSELLSIPLESPLGTREVARILVHPEGYLAKVSSGSQVVVYLSRLGSREVVDELKGMIEEVDREGRIYGVFWR